MLIQRPIFKSALQSAIGWTAAGALFLVAASTIRGTLGRLDSTAVVLHLFIFILAFIVYLASSANYQWFLEPGFLIKRRTYPPRELARIDFRRIVAYRCQRQPPFVGRYWCLLVCAPFHDSVGPTDFIIKPFVEFGSRGQIYRITPITKYDKDMLVNAIREYSEKTN